MVIRSHGAPPWVYEKLKEKGVKVCDATCPMVIRVQRIVSSFAKKGRKILILGEKGHSEVSTLLEYAKGKGKVVGNEKELIEVLKELLPQESVSLVSQTTQNKKKFKKIETILKEKRKDVLVFDTICKETDERQEETRKLAKECDAVIVVGGKNSANTRRLKEIAEAQGTETFHIETEKELPTEKLSNYKKIGITAGASTPNWLIQRVIYELEKIVGKKNWIENILIPLWRFIIRSHLFVALGAALLSYTCARLQGIEPSIAYEWIAASYIFAMHLLNHITDPTTLEINYPARSDFYRKFRKLLIILGIGGILSSLVVAGFLGVLPFIVVLGMSILGALYRIQIVPKPLRKKTGYSKLMDIPASKDLFLAIAWAFILVLLHLMSERRAFTLSSLVAFLFTFTIAFNRSLIYSIRDVQGDMMTGRESIPVIAGVRNTKFLSGITLGGIGFLLLYGWLAGWVSSLAPLLTLPLLYYLFFLSLSEDSEIFYKDITFETVVDANLIFSAVLSYLWYLFF